MWSGLSDLCLIKLSHCYVAMSSLGEMGPCRRLHGNRTYCMNIVHMRAEC